MWSGCERSANMVVMSVPLAGEPRAAVSDRPVRPRSPRRPRRARIVALFVGVVVGLFGLFAFPAGAAQAHAALIRTSPAQGSIVTSAPSEIVVTFSEVVQPVATRIMVIAPDGKRIDSGSPRVQGDDMHIPVRTNVPGGTYLVSYRVISADSHPVGGGFTYSVGAPSPGGAPKPVNGGEKDKVVATSVSVMQFVGFVGLILVLGPAMVLIALWPRRLDRRQPIRIVYGGLGLIAVATIAGLYLQAPYDSGGSLTSVTGADLSDVFDSHFGQANLVRLALLLIMGFLLRPVLAGKGTKTEHILLAVLGTVGVATWALAGHPGASDVAPLTTVADIAHLASVGTGRWPRHAGGVPPAPGECARTQRDPAGVVELGDACRHGAGAVRHRAGADRDRHRARVAAHDVRTAGHREGAVAGGDSRVRSGRRPSCSDMRAYRRHCWPTPTPPEPMHRTKRLRSR